jgi:prefoldin subunit 5
VKNDWDNAINLVKMKINECDQNINSWQQSIDQLTEEQKKMTMYSILAAFGAFLAFTAAVFLPGVGMLAALAVGAALGGIAVWQAIEANKITESINDLKAAVRNAQDTRAKLEALLTPMQEIAQNLSQVSLIWSDIATALTKLDAFYKVLNGPTGPAILDLVKPQVIIQWGVVNTNVQNYINTVAK